VLVSCGCHLLVSNEVPLNSSSNVHDQEPLGGAIGAGAPPQGREVSFAAAPTELVAGGGVVASAGVDVDVDVVVGGGNVVVVTGSGATAGAGLRAVHVLAPSFRALHVPGVRPWGSEPHAPGPSGARCVTLQLADGTDRSAFENATRGGVDRPAEKGALRTTANTHTTSATPQSEPAMMRAPVRHFGFGSATILPRGRQFRTPIASDGNARRTENLSRK